MYGGGGAGGEACTLWGEAGAEVAVQVGAGGNPGGRRH